MNPIWLSHSLSENTPLYGGANDIRFSKLKSISDGDSCNAGHVSMPFHSGTHVDAPLHFVENGRSLTDIEPYEWIYRSPEVILLNSKPGELITPESLNFNNVNIETDLIIIKTGFENRRNESVYWELSPGLAPECADYFTDKFKSLKAVGFDFISISSLKHRDKGRLAHNAFLKKEILIFEDMSLRNIDISMKLRQVIALPLRFNKSDGAPVTILGLFENI